MIRYVSIGNGLYCRTRQRISLLEEYRRLQTGCTHEKRDPRGMCYRCGDIDPEWRLKYGSEESAEVARYLGYGEGK